MANTFQMGGHHQPGKGKASNGFSTNRSSSSNPAGEAAAVPISQCRVFFLQQDYQNPNSKEEAQAAHWGSTLCCNLPRMACPFSMLNCRRRWNPKRLWLRSSPRCEVGHGIRSNLCGEAKMLSDGRKELMDQMKTLYEYGYNMGMGVELGSLTRQYMGIMGWLWMASYFEGQRVNRSIGSAILTRMVTRLRFRVCRVKASWMPRCAVTPRLQTAVKL